MIADILPQRKEDRLRDWWASGTVLAPDAHLPQARDLTPFWTDVDFIIERKMARIEQTVGIAGLAGTSRDIGHV